MPIMSAVEQDFSANACVGNVGHVNLHLVHADAPDDWRNATFHQHLPRTGKLPGKTVTITKWHNAYLGAALCGESSVVAQSVSGCEFLNAGDAAGNAHGKFKVHHFACILRRINPIKSQANAHPVVMSFR